MVGLRGVEERDRVAVPQLLATPLANERAVDVCAVAAKIVEVDVAVLVRAADLAVLSAAQRMGG